MKKILAMCLISIAATSFAKELESYKEIKEAIAAGNALIVATDFSHCKTPMPVAGQFEPSEIMIANNSIIFSVNHFTTNNPSTKGKAVNEYTTYTLNADGSFMVNTQVVTLPEEHVQPFATNSCLLNQDVKFYTTK